MGENGDVLLTWENEARHALQRFGARSLQIVYPSRSIQAEPVVAIVNRYADARGSRAAIKEFIDVLFSTEGQRLAAQNYLRPRHAAVSTEFAGNFPQIDLFTVREAFGSWAEVQAIHFSRGGTLSRVLESYDVSDDHIP